MQPAGETGRPAFKLSYFLRFPWTKIGARSDKTSQTRCEREQSRSEWLDASERDLKL